MKNYARTPTIFQMEATECGAAALAMILAYHGRNIPLEQVRIDVDVTRYGCKAENIKKAAEECHGLTCEHFYYDTSSESYSQICQLPMPCIIWWNYNHFVVLEGIRWQGEKFKCFYINDPARGRLKLTEEEFSRGFMPAKHKHGVVMTFQKTKEFQKKRKKSSLLTTLKKRLSGQYSVIFKLFYIGLLLVFPGLVLPVLSQVFIDDVLCRGYTDWLTRILIFMGACMILRMSLSYYRGTLLQKLKSKMSLVSGKKFLHHLFRLPIVFFTQRSPGVLMQRMQNNIELNDFLAGDFAETILNCLIAVFYLVILFFYSPVMASIGVAEFVISITITLIGRKMLMDFMNKSLITLEKFQSAVISGIGNMDSLQASGAEVQYSEKLLGYQANYAEACQKSNRFQQIVNCIPEGLKNITDVVLLLIGSILVIRGEITMGMLVAFNSLFDSFSQPVNSIIQSVKDFQNLKAQIYKVEDIENYSQDAAFDLTQKKQQFNEKLKGNIEIKQIRFGYSRLQPAFIENFSISLRAGESVAITGESKCGKSTIFKIIGGIYSPWDGEILIDGICAQEIPEKILHASVACIEQGLMLFPGTVRDNITMLNSAILEEDMIAAAKDACIHDVIQQLPGGYDYQISENTLSGGECQRIEIARALATNPSVLIMDEATSALDPLTEKQVMDNLRRRGCTCIMIAHRLSTIKDCNEIIVMKEGKIIQHGTHEELLKSVGEYHNLVCSC